MNEGIRKTSMACVLPSDSGYKPPKGWKKCRYRARLWNKAVQVSHDVPFYLRHYFNLSTLVQNATALKPHVSLGVVPDHRGSAQQISILSGTIHYCLHCDRKPFSFAYILSPFWHKILQWPTARQPRLQAFQPAASEHRKYPHSRRNISIRSR